MGRGRKSGLHLLQAPKGWGCIGRGRKSDQALDYLFLISNKKENRHPAPAVTAAGAGLSFLYKANKQ